MDTVNVLCKHIPMQRFEIFEPRYHDKRVLLSVFKVGEHNKIYFTKAPSMGTEPYYVSGKTVKKYPKVSNGTIMTYSVPLDELRPLELPEHCIHEYN